MKLLFLIAADCANLTGDGKLNIMGIFQDILSSSFPTRQPTMHLIAGLSADMGEYGDERDLVVKLLDEDGHELLRYVKPIQNPKGEGGRKPTVFVILELKDIIFPKPGAYQFILMVDKDHKGELTIYANKSEAFQISG